MVTNVNANKLQMYMKKYLIYKVLINNNIHNCNQYVYICV